MTKLYILSPQKVMRFLATCFLIIASSGGVVWGQIHTNACASATAGWTYTNGTAAQSIQQTGYWLVEDADVITSEPFNVSSFTGGLALTFQVATYGSGSPDKPCLVEYSEDNGSTWSATTFTSATPSSSTFISAGTFNIPASAATQFKFRFKKASSGGRQGVRIDNISFTGTIASGPTIVLSSPSQVTAANLPQNTTDRVLSQFQAAVTTANATLNSIAFTTAGTHVAGDLTGNFKLWYNTTNNFGTASTISTLASGAAGARTFTGLSQAISNGNTGFFWITVNSSTSAIAGNTINVAASPTLTFAAGSPTGSITVGGTQTITDVTAPTATVFSPLDNATGVAIASNLVITFSENIVKGTGNILIKRVSDNSVVESIDVTTGLVSVSTTTATINPASDLLNSTAYYIEIPATAFSDASSNFYLGISGATAWNFTTVAATPTITLSAAALYNFGETYLDSSSTLQYYTVAGTGLTANIVITAPTNFVISSTCGSGYGSTVTLTQSGGTVSTTTIYARFKPTTLGAKSGNITHTSTGATTQNKAVAGTGVGSYIPAGYYSTAIGTGYTLKSQLKAIIDGHTKRTYDNLWDDYQMTDKKYNGKVWDMYSNKPCTDPSYDYTFITAQCTATPITAEAQCYNREHVFPSSWFGGTSPFTGSGIEDTIGTDLQMVMPTDGWVNAERGNFPYAAVASPSSTFTNGSKVGTSTTSGYSGSAFEPIDEYKGDFARIMLYVAVRYERSIGSWQGNSSANNVLDGTSTKVYDDWFIDQLIAWHNADPVSHKEIIRNQQAYLIQGNRNPFIDNPTLVSSIWLADVTPPTVTTLSPLDNATSVAVSSNLVITFSEVIAKGTGNIVIKRTSDNAVIETIDVTSGLVTVSTNTATINPTSDLGSSTEYYVVIDATAFKDGSNNFYAGISSTTAWSFTTADIIAPTAAAFSPLDNAVNVLTADNLVITFSENISKGTGNILIKKVSDNSIVQTIDVTTGIVTVSGVTATINPASNLPEGVDYYVEIPATAFKDASNNFYAGFSGTTTWNFLVPDITAPIVTTLSPLDNATGVAVSSNLVITFSENVVASTGNIVIKLVSDNSIVETISAASGLVSYSSNVVTINPTADFASGTAYYVQIDATAFKDGANNAYAGIATTTAWNFTAADIIAPTASALSPVDNATGVAGSTNLVITFSENISKGTVGNIIIRKTSDNSVVQTIDVTTAAVAVSGVTATINPPADLGSSTEYYVVIDATAFKDASNNFYAGISSTTAWSFTTAAGACASETFAGIGSATGYGARSWTGDNGGSWSATDAREDQTITGKAITVRNGSLFSNSVAGGCGVITVSHKISFSETSPSFTVWVNGTQYGAAIVPTSGVQTSNITVNAGGAVSVELRSNGARITFDDLSWTCYVACTSPTTAATSLSFSSVTATTMRISFTRGNGDGGVLAVLRQGSAPSAGPVSGITYTADANFAGTGSSLGSGKVIYNSNTPASGTVNIDVTGLTGGAISYYVAIYEYNAAGTCYNSTALSGNQATSVITPTVTTPTSASIASTTATLGGNVTSDGGGTISVRGIVWSTSDATPTIAEGATNVTTTGTTGVFTTAVTGLPAGTLIYYAAYATNSAGTGYSTASSFTTLTIASKLVITGITFAAPVSAYTADQNFSITVQSQDASSVARNVTVNTEVTLSVSNGTGSLTTLTGIIAAGTNSTTITTTYSEVESGVQFIASATSGMSLTASAASSAIRFYGLDEVVFPQYIVANTSTNRLPIAYRVTISGLNASASYRIINGCVVAATAANNAGAGNCYFVPTAGSFVYTTAASINTNYNTITTDASGNYTGWFITEPTNNTIFDVGTGTMYVRFTLNDGAGGTTPALYLTSKLTMSPMNFGAAAANATGIYSVSQGTAMDFVVLHDNTAGTGRPLYANFIESDGNTVAASTHVGFYDTNVDPTAGAWGALIPNTNANGVRYIAERSRNTGEVVGCAATDADGIWPTGSISTVNPTGGTTARVINFADAPLTCQPEIQVLINPTNYNTGSTYGFGFVDPNFNNDVTFEITNTGVVPLIISSSPVTGTGFSLVTPPAASVAVGGSTTFTVRFFSASTGTFTGNITLNNNDLNEAAYVVNLSAAILPEIIVEQNETNVPDGSGSVSFGTASPGGFQDKVFVIYNIGSGTLNLSAPTFGNAQYSISGAFPSSVPSGGNESFTVRFAPTAGADGTINSTISFVNNDADENPYNFNLTGYRATPPTINITAVDPSPSAQFTLGSQNNVAYRVTLRSLGNDATLTSMNFTTSGTYANLDVTSFRLWYSPDNSFDKNVDTEISTPLTGGTGGNLLFDGFTQTLLGNTDAFFFVTTNIRIDNAASGKTVGLSLSGFSDLTFSGSPVAGTVSVSAGANHTIVSPSVKFNLETVNLTEGTGVGTTTYNIPLRFFGTVPVGQDITISIAGAAAWGAGSDFTFGTPATGLTKISENATTLVLRTGSITTPATINVPITIVRDGLDELDEDVVLTIASAGAIFIDASASVFTLNILDDDIKSVISFTKTEQFMGEAGGGSYTVSMDIIPAAATSGNIVINVAETDMTYGGTSPNDYTTSPAKSGSTITIPVTAGATSASFTITINADDANTNPKTINSQVVFTLASVPSNAEIGATGTTHTLKVVEGTLLEPGDLAIVGFNTTNGLSRDEFSFVCFKDLTPGTTIDVTDNAYNKCTPGIASPSSSNYRTGGFGQSEGWVRMTFTSGANIPKGTVITIEISGSTASNYPGSSCISPAGRTFTFAGLSTRHGDFNLNGSGEQIFFLQGGTLDDNTSGSGSSTDYGDDLYVGGRVLYVFNTKGDIWTPKCSNSSGGGTQNSDKPGGIDCFISFPSTTADFSKYTGPITAATQREWIGRIQGSTNWTGYAGNTAYNAAPAAYNYRGGIAFTINTGNFVEGIWEGTTSTDWFDCRNWQSLSVPDKEADVSFASAPPNNILIAGDTAECRNLTIANTRTLTISTNGNLDLYNNFANNGTFTHSAGTVRMLSSTPSSISQSSGTVAFRALTINNSGGVLLNNDISVNNALNLSAGTLAMNGKKITLISSSMDISLGAELDGNANGSTLEFTGTGSTNIPSGSFDRVNIDRSGSSITMAGDLVLRGSTGTALDYANGTLNLNNYGLTIESGAITGANGRLQAKGSTTSGNDDLIINGTGAVGTLRTIGNFDDFSLNRGVSGTITMGSDFIINDECNLVEGNMTIGSNTLTLRGDINWTNGTLTGSTTSNLTVEQINGTTSRLILPSVSGGLGNVSIKRLNGMALFGSLPVAGVVSFSASSPAAGGIYTTGDTLDLGTTGSITGEIANVNTRFVSGILKATRTVGAGASSTFGNVGVAVGSAPNNLGSVNVYRYSGTAYAATLNSATGIGRLWAIRPTTQPSGAISLSITWPADDDNGKVFTSNAQVYRRPEGSTDWLNVGTTQAPVVSSGMRTVTVSTTAFSDWTVSDDLNILPVTLLSFTGTVAKDVAVLNWTTASERDNDGFSIEKSLDGVHFTAIDFVKGAGNSSHKLRYAYNDPRFAQSAYYRLAQRDYNGKVTYSHTIQLRKEAIESLIFGLYPNPAQNRVTLSMEGQLHEGGLYLSMFAADGREIGIAEGTHQALNEKLNQWLVKLPMGVYMIKVKTTNSVHHLRLVKE